jgi:hypothetical protein
MESCGLDLCGLGWGPMAKINESDADSLVSVKDEDPFEYMIECSSLTNDSSP